MRLFAAVFAVLMCLTTAARADDARISSAAFGLPDDGTAQTVFSSRTTKIVLHVLSKNVTPQTPISSEWFAVKVPGAPENKKVGTLVAKPERDEKLHRSHFTMTSDGGWPAGDYRVDLRLGDGPVLRSAAFTMVAEDKTGTGPQIKYPGLKSWSFSAEGGAKAQSVFSPDTTKILLRVQLVNIAKGMTASSEWIAEKAEGAPVNQSIDSANVRFDEDRELADVTFSLGKKMANWPVGDYRVELRINGMTVSAPNFAIAVQNTPPATQAPAKPVATAPSGGEGGGAAPANAANLLACVKYVSKTYEGGEAPSPVAGQSKTQAWCSCFQREKPDFAGDLGAYLETGPGKKTDTLCNRYADWGED